MFSSNPKLNSYTQEDEADFHERNCIIYNDLCMDRILQSFRTGRSCKIIRRKQKCINANNYYYRNK
jgi:hypothetical protein